MESGWLIERKCSKGNEWVNQYWLPGHQPLPGEFRDGHDWVSNAMNAIRFSRQQDALIAIDRFHTGANVMATEHGFGA